MTTKIYGASDDLIEFDGDIRDECGAIAASDSDQKTMIFCSDGTILRAVYDDEGMWRFPLVVKGALYDRTDVKAQEDDEGHSDIVHFKDGMKYAYVGFEVYKAS